MIEKEEKQVLVINYLNELRTAFYSNLPEDFVEATYQAVKLLNNKSKQIKSQQELEKLRSWKA